LYGDHRITGVHRDDGHILEKEETLLPEKRKGDLRHK